MIIFRSKVWKVADGREGAFIHQAERRFGEFVQSIPLPGYVQMDSIKAKYEDGMLRVVFDKEPLQESKDKDETKIDID